MMSWCILAARRIDSLPTLKDISLTAATTGYSTAICHDIDSSGLPTGERIVATMGLIQEHRHRIRNLDHFNYDHFVRNSTSWLSYCDWMHDTSKSLRYINVLLITFSNDDDQCVCISYPYQAMMMINVSISHIYIKQWRWSICLYTHTLIKWLWWSISLHLIFFFTSQLCVNLSDESEDICNLWSSFIKLGGSTLQTWSYNRWLKRDKFIMSHIAFSFSSSTSLSSSSITLLSSSSIILAHHHHHHRGHQVFVM